MFPDNISCAETCVRRCGCAILAHATKGPWQHLQEKRVTDQVTRVADRLRTPLQLWLPRLGGDLGRPEVARDAQRAYAAWAGDRCVWLSPEFPRRVRWRRGDFLELALPAEHVERLDVYHIGQNGRASGYGARHRFPGGRIDGLLDAWLNIGELGGCRSAPAPDWLALDFPEICEQEVRYATVKITVEGGAQFPTHHGPAGQVAVYWPPEGSAVVPTMFPDAESLSLTPPLTRSVDDTGRPIVIYRDGAVADPVINEWAEPIGSLMPALGSFGDLISQQRMAMIAQASTHDLESALQDAQREAAPFLGTAHSSWADAWVYPTLLNHGPEPILFRAEELGVAAGDLVEAYAALRAGTLSHPRLAAILGRSAEFQRAMAEPVVVRRAWGATGLFWVLLLEELEARRPFSSCQRCGRIIHGKKGKSYCGPNDKRTCYRARRATDQRRARGRAG